MRRARIKAVANLSAARRPASSLTTKSESENTPCDDGNSSISADNEANQSLDLADAPTAAMESHDSKSTLEKSRERSGFENQLQTQQTITFKTPLQRNETEQSSSVQQNTDKFKRFKIAPRLNAARPGVAKSQKIETVCSAADGACENEGKPEEKLQELRFTLPTKSRVEAPRDLGDMQMQYPSAPPSPFPYAFGHSSRIRTDSLCSMKSNRDVTAANLQPRKNIRTEDQKIQDQKKESRERLSNKDLDKSQLRMFDMIYFNPLGNPMKQRSPSKNIEKKSEPTQEPPTDTFTQSASVAVPQLRLNANGEMVLDETSLVIESEQQKQNRNALAASNVVYDDDLSGNYGYYKRQQRTKEWPHEETVKFYRCLNTVGTDFSLMLNLFPNRSRRDLKLKFKKEEKNNPQLIDKALLKHNTFDLDELKKDLDKEEEERRKAADSKSSSEVKELVKRKILRKQEAKLKIQTKTKVEKVLTEGAAVINIVDHVNPQEVKENLNISLASPVISRPKKVEVEAGATSVMALFYSTVPKPVKRPRQSKASNISGDTTPIVKKPRKKNQTSGVQTALTSSIKEEFPIANPAKPLHDVNDTIATGKVSNIPFVRSINDPRPIDEAEISFKMVDAEGSYLEMKNSEEFSSDDTTAHAAKLTTNNELQESDHRFALSEAESCANSDAAFESLDVDLQSSVATQCESFMTCEKAGTANKKPKARRGKHKPTLVTRLKLDANGDMVSDEAAIKPTTSAENIDVDPSKQVEITLSTGQKPSEDAPGSPTSVLQTATSKTSCVFDDEISFLNNLDLEKLVLVEVGDVFEIHEINPVTQEISEVPLDLPARYFDLIIKVMTSQDEECL